MRVEGQPPGDLKLTFCIHMYMNMLHLIYTIMIFQIDFLPNSESSHIDHRQKEGIKIITFKTACSLSMFI